MKQLIPKTFIQDVVARTDIVPLIQSRIELKKRGNTYVACCPFHHEKTPSFTVSQTKQFYYCFGCGAHGNAIGFLMNYAHLSFVEAVRELAQPLGLTIPFEENETGVENTDALYSALLDAQERFEAALKQSPSAIQYLKNRGLTGKIAKTFAIGYAPPSWDFLSMIAQKKQALLETGMIIEKTPTRFYDRFRDRIMFPIRDLRGRTIAFGGRTLTNETPKYLNSPGTPLFCKHELVYGLYEACQQRAALTQLLMVEGYMDVVALAQFEIYYAVATLGTALNVKHIQLLLRYTKHIIFCFDGDEAGQKAAWKALTLCLPLIHDGLQFRFLFLPPTEDPDSQVRKVGKKAFEAAIQQASPLSQVFFEILRKKHDISILEGKAALGKEAQALIDTMPDGIYKNLLLTELANHLEMAKTDLPQTKKAEISLPPPPARPSSKRMRLNPALTAIQLLLQNPLLAKDTPPLTYCPTPETTLLSQLITACHISRSVHFGDLLETLESKDMQKELARIAALPLAIPESGYHAEFSDAMQRLEVQQVTDQITQLIHQAKQNELSNSQKQQLQLLLAKKREYR